MDRIWTRHDLERRLGARFVRYADDVVILCRRGTALPMATLRSILQRLDLTLNEHKTCVVDATEQRFDFLGFSIGWSTSWRSGKGYAHVEPSHRAVQRLKRRVKELTSRRRTAVPMPALVGELNRALRGWSGYFHQGNCSKVFSALRLFTGERLRTHLRRRHKLRGRAQAYQRFPDTVLYQHLGLFPLPTVAGWESAHASA